MGSRAVSYGAICDFVRENGYRVTKPTTSNNVPQPATYETQMNVRASEAAANHSTRRLQPKETTTSTSSSTHQHCDSDTTDRANAVAVLLRCSQPVYIVLAVVVESKEGERESK